MKILIAEDNSVNRFALSSILASWGYELVVVCDGKQAWEEIQKEDAPRVAIIGWEIPNITAAEICRKVRETATTKAIYIIITSTSESSVMGTAIESGADDIIFQPIDLSVLKARLKSGVRIVELQKRLTDRVKELQDALSQLKQLQGILPICAYCKRVRDDHNYWQQVEAYICSHTQAKFSHGICPDCFDEVLKHETEHMAVGF